MPKPVREAQARACDGSDALREASISGRPKFDRLDAVNCGQRIGAAAEAGKCHARAAGDKREGPASHRGIGKILCQIEYLQHENIRFRAQPWPSLVQFCVHRNNADQMLN